ncbi:MULTISPECIES: hypothetical protein [unclassified Streptomyces]|uniref:hypothetical protein n=1 Tax=unclassified Streptomyces TaxID=2593676 RepID=UPI00038220F5|nr:hypothetical protein [Streptomyces sp. BoleA5]
MSDSLALATCTYQEFQPVMGVPVRTTAGHPRFPLAYQLAGHARLVTPTRQLLAANLPEDAYEFSYRRLLAGHGLDAITAELAAIAAGHEPGRPLVLLCFDRLNKPGAWCHRSHLARWWTEQTGQDVPELGARPAGPPPATLFD